MEKLIGPSAATEGEHNSTGNSTEFKRWSANRKKEAVLRMMRGEPADTLSRELSIEIIPSGRMAQESTPGDGRSSQIP